MEKLQRSLNVAVVLAEISHIFCCVLPTVVSVMSVLVGVGLIGSLPIGLLVLHDYLHDWEVPIIVGSGLLIAVAWLFVWCSHRVDCHDTGCEHGPCEPKKKKSSRLLKLATILFVINVSVYSVFHRGLLIEIPAASVSTQPGMHDDHHGHHNHDH
ncbi:MAG: hypothetical protein AB8B83_02520 [Bdellovibrionales bacterium]